MATENLVKYKEYVSKVLQNNEEAVNMIFFETEKEIGISLLGRHPFLFHSILAILTNLLYPLAGLKRTVSSNDDDFIFISCPDTVFRTKTIGQIAAELKYGVIYLPNFHIRSALKYNRFFKRKKNRIYFPTIHLKYVFGAIHKMSVFKKLCGKVDRQPETRRLFSVMSSFFIYDYVVKDYLSRINNDFHGKWILEHDKFYFMSSVVNLHQRGQKCTMLQHGCFMEIDTDFMPLFCDQVLCCSNRERDTYINCGLSPENVITFGAPLQMLGTNDSFDVKTGKKHSLLILLTIANEESIEPMRAVLSFVKDNYQDVLVRMRPRSKKNDIRLLEKELRGLEISDNKSSLAEDIFYCDKVISFSEDANIEVTKHNKPFIYVHPWLGENRELRRDMPYATMENYRDEIKKLMENEFYSSFSKEQYKEIVGETDVNVLRQRFKDYIKS